jgi:hypothetical protein
MAPEKNLFKITIKRCATFEVQHFFVEGTYEIAKSDRGISLKVVEDFIFTHEHGAGAYGTDWVIESVEDIGGLYELMQKEK